MLFPTIFNANIKMKKRRRIFYQQLCLFFGIIIGIILFVTIITKLRPCKKLPSTKNYFQENLFMEDLDQKKKLVFIGIMTTNTFLKTRCRAIYNTWAKTIPGKIVFFTSEKSEWFNDIPMIRLPKVDDSYPPQKKAFMMLKFMHDNYLNKFEFFLRADDDVFIRGDRLESFLRSINSTQALLIGQAGFGNKEEKGKLGLDDDENYCMGGPGMIMSKETLRRIAPFIKTCLHNLFTTHEDVEIGRCIQFYSNISCTWAYEMQILFHQEYEGIQSYANNIKRHQIINSISLHPFKKMEYQYKMNKFFAELRIEELRQAILILERKNSEIVKKLRNYFGNFSYNRNTSLNERILDYPSFNHERKAANRYREINFEYICHAMYSTKNLVPKKGLEKFYNPLFSDSLRQYLEIKNSTYKHLNYDSKWLESNYVYFRNNKLVGLDIIMSKKVKYSTNKFYRTIHLNLRKTFNDLVFKEDNTFNSFHIAATNDSHLIEEIQMSPLNETINFIVPLAGRFQSFSRFISNFENVCLKNNESVSLTIILFSTDDDKNSTETIQEKIKSLQTTYQNHLIQLVILSSKFSRSLACETGASMFNESSLLLIIDIDLIVNREFLFRVRTHTVRHRQTYFPIFFSQYNPIFPEMQQRESPIFGNKSIIHGDNGYWRQYSFGVFSSYKSDFVKTGGFNKNITGWGKEDIDLYEKFISAKITVFRSIDPGLIHIYHDILCDESLDVEQKLMCLGTLYPTQGSQRLLSQYVYKNLYNF